MNHETDGDEVVIVVIEEGATAGAVGQRPAERVLHQARAMSFWCDLPELLETDAEFLRLTTCVQAEALHHNLAEIAARTFGKQRIFRAQFHAAREAVLAAAVPGETHVAGRDARDCAVRIE